MLKMGQNFHTCLRSEPRAPLPLSVSKKTVFYHSPYWDHWGNPFVVFVFKNQYCAIPLIRSVPAIGKLIASHGHIHTLSIVASELVLFTSSQFHVFIVVRP